MDIYNGEIDNDDISEEIKELLEGLLDNEIEREIVLLVMTKEKYEVILEEVLKRLKMRGNVRDRI